ncbi:Tripartite Motif-Containing Protein 3 [Manis pentadactyla]|nr:Tripartite Motif-Containing Protein 3 [Manis pentadactyla]
MAVVRIIWYTQQKLGAAPVPGDTTSQLNGKFRDHFEHNEGGAIRDGREVALLRFIRIFHFHLDRRLQDTRSPGNHQRRKSASEPATKSSFDGFSRDFPLASLRLEVDLEISGGSSRFKSLMEMTYQP